MPQMIISRREFLQVMAAAGFAVAVDITPLKASELPTNTTLAADGVDFNGILGGIYVMPIDNDREALAEMWVTRPNGSLMLHHTFSQRSSMCWMAEPSMYIVGQDNVSCSVYSDILLAGNPV
ncbi:MAG: hypothetical protein V3S69_00960 [Dehalococcoidales bacterium]